MSDALPSPLPFSMLNPSPLSSCRQKALCEPSSCPTASTTSPLEGLTLEMLLAIFDNRSTWRAEHNRALELSHRLRAEIDKRHAELVEEYNTNKAEHDRRVPQLAHVPLYFFANWREWGEYLQQLEKYIKVVQQHRNWLELLEGTYEKGARPDGLWDTFWKLHGSREEEGEVTDMDGSVTLRNWDEMVDYVKKVSFSQRQIREGIEKLKSVPERPEGWSS